MTGASFHYSIFFVTKLCRPNISFPIDFFFFLMCLISLLLSFGSLYIVIAIEKRNIFGWMDSTSLLDKGESKSNHEKKLPLIPTRTIDKNKLSLARQLNQKEIFFLILSVVPSTSFPYYFVSWINWKCHKRYIFSLHLFDLIFPFKWKEIWFEKKSFIGSLEGINFQIFNWGTKNFFRKNFWKKKKNGKSLNRVRKEMLMIQCLEGEK